MCRLSSKTGSQCRNTSPTFSQKIDTRPWNGYKCLQNLSVAEHQTGAAVRMAIVPVTRGIILEIPFIPSQSNIDLGSLNRRGIGVEEMIQRTKC
jgi:hypothetical protein